MLCIRHTGAQVQQPFLMHSCQAQGLNYMSSICPSIPLSNAVLQESNACSASHTCCLEINCHTVWNMATGFSVGFLFVFEFKG